MSVNGAPIFVSVCLQSHSKRRLKNNKINWCVRFSRRLNSFFGFQGRYNKSNLHDDGKTSKCIGSDLVMKLLKNYCRNKDIKTSIRVGIVGEKMCHCIMLEILSIGAPNVGKSSVINSLTRRKTCQVGATPGITRFACCVSTQRQKWAI